MADSPKLTTVPDPEVPAGPKRRRFTAEYKLRILREWDSLTKPGAKGELLRREGLYSSHVTSWQRARETGALQGLRPRKTGRPRKERNPLQAEVDRLEREKARLQEELRKANLIIDVQKKLASMLGSPTESTENDV